MKTVKEVSKLTGVSVRTLHHYDEIGLLRPTKVTEAGYRLYDADTLERLYLIIIYRELGFSLKEIRGILDAPDYDRNRVLEQQIELLERKRHQLQNRIYLAQGLKLTGVRHLDYTGFDYKKLDEYTDQAQLLWGKTPAWQEYTQKAKGRSKEQSKALGDQVMALMVKVGSMRDQSPDSPAVQAWVRELQEFFNENYYTCTKPMLKVLGEMYAGGGSMTENIDAAGGKGTGAFAKQAIDIYCGE